MSENMLDFQCPHCSTNHRLPIEFAGNRQPCSTCGKTMRLPSVIGANSSQTQDSVTHQAQGGAIMVTCPLCSKTLYASKQQAGKEILCETCLESISVPALTPSKGPDRTVLSPDRIDQSPEASQVDHQGTELEVREPTRRNPNVSGPIVPDHADQLNGRSEPESPGSPSNVSKQSESAELNLAPLTDEPQIPTSSAADSSPPVKAIPDYSPAQPEAFHADEEIIELEAVGEAPSIPVQPLQAIRANTNVDSREVVAVEYELIVRWAKQCPSCQSQLTVYQMDVGKTVQCEKCNQPVTVEAIQPMPRPERQQKIQHQFIADQTRVAFLSPNQPQPKQETLYKSVIEWQVECDVCGTGIAATAEDVGAQKKCPDCFKVHTITAPAKMPTPVQRAVRNELADDSPTPMASSSSLGQPSAQPAPGKQVLSETPEMREKLERDQHIASRQILQRARQEHARREEEEEALELDKDSWFRTLAQLLTLPTVVSRVAILSFGYAVVGWLLHSATRTPSGGSIITTIGYIGNLVSCVVIFTGVSAFAFSTLLNIVKQTSIGDLQISEWPAFNLWEFITESFIIFLSIAYVSIPGGTVFWVTSMFLKGFLGIVPLILCTLIMTTLFPYFLLGIMESGNLWQPISSSLNQRLKLRSDLLVKFVLFGIPAVFTSIVGAIMVLNKSKIAVMFAMVMIWISLVYLCRLVGLLAISMASVDD